MTRLLVIAAALLLALPPVHDKVRLKSVSPVVSPTLGKACTFALCSVTV